jgi:hypothetical protein
MKKQRVSIKSDSTFLTVTLFFQGSRAGTLWRLIHIDLDAKAPYNKANILIWRSNYEKSTNDVFDSLRGAYDAGWFICVGSKNHRF